MFNVVLFRVLHQFRAKKLSLSLALTVSPIKALAEMSRECEQRRLEKWHCWLESDGDVPAWWPRPSVGAASSGWIHVDERDVKLKFSASSRSKKSHLGWKSEEFWAAVVSSRSSNYADQHSFWLRVCELKARWTHSPRRHFSLCGPKHSLLVLPDVVNMTWRLRRLHDHESI